MTIRETRWRKTGVDPGWFERLGLVTHLLSARYAQYLACDSVIEPVFVDADGRVVATGERAPLPASGHSRTHPTPRPRVRE